MKTKTIRFRTSLEGKWASLGVSYIDEKTISVPAGMELDARGGVMRWHPDTPTDKRDFERREITFEYQTLEEANPPTNKDIQKAAEIAAGVTDDAWLDALKEQALSGDTIKIEKLKEKLAEIVKKMSLIHKPPL